MKKNNKSNPNILESFSSYNKIIRAHSDHHLCLNIVILNIRSLRTNFERFLLEVDNAFNIHAFILIETNIKDEEVGFYNITGYNAYFKNRVGKRGGGIAVFIRDGIPIHIEDQQTLNFECLDFIIEIGSKKLEIISIYRPPSTYNTTSFTQELRSLLERKNARKDLLVTGDINLDLLKNNDYVSEYLDMMAEYGLKNKNKYIATREDLNRRTSTNIDHLFIRTNSCRKDESYVIKSEISDHYSISTRLFFNSEPKTVEHIPKAMLSNKKVDEMLKRIDWHVIEEKDSASKIYVQFLSKITGIYEEAKYIPSNKGRPRKNWANA